ncbi:AfsA-related hotdog domain-containing protein [Actinoplanes regularis]|uniref:A-factor biosynthesis hotdog domain-containing protein n=1 Tax=Actinoplanes regularis TaxID=52697 RepID=A0A239F7N0_9ACTN|nr:AfsA-related hotdog domain-containing protein [Actinoplanes regularis]GIE89983.1 hypothetical protein Are01nite_64630 [Actinoplanes regularis]SNS52084.1 A-factor biosynthesis hotdog domain-containing protein [Actinoplanes regularis]
MTHRSATALSDHKTSGLLGPVLRSVGPGDRTARLNIDQNDPFFFDHPLDHVPGMLFVCGIADLARTGTPARFAGRIQGSLTFRKICEPDPAPALWYATSNRRGKARITQDAATVADGWFALSPAAPPVAHAHRLDPGRWLPAEAALVHRTRAENIVLGEPWREDGQITALVLPPPWGHRLAGPAPDTYPIECLIEAGRQFSTWLAHRQARWPVDAQLLWIGVTGDLPTRLPRPFAVALRWRVAPLTGTKAKFHFDLVNADGRGPALGSLSFACKALSPAEYALFRENREQVR